ncbi:MAG: CoA transferase [Blautia sp.]|nr:CoA transferase [Blautia sp.]
MSQTKGALDGVVVLDLSRVLAGPYCSMILADMGAEVIKVEIPGRGDDTRGFPPFKEGKSGYFMNMNRNKKGITLNLKKGKDVFFELVKKADILIENYRPGTMEKLGFGYDVLKEINPKLVYGCISGFGHYGPYSKRPGYDIVGQAMSGIMSVTGWPDGEATRAGAPVSDTVAGISLAAGVLGALHHAQKTGEGQKVDIALVDSLVSVMQIINQIYLIGGRLPGRMGNQYESTAPYDTFPTADGKYVVIGIANDKFWKQLCEMMDREDLIDHPDYAKNGDRVKNRDIIKPIVVEWTKTQQSDELVNRLLEAGIPTAPIYDVKQVTEDPHIAGAREMFIDIEDPEVGPIKVTNTHIKMSETKQGFRFPAPMLGQHNQEIYGDFLGYTQEEIRKMQEDGII